jgi:hypothetical protein
VGNIKDYERYVENLDEIHKTNLITSVRRAINEAPIIGHLTG